MISRSALFTAAVVLAAALAAGGWHVLSDPPIEGVPVQDGPLPLPPVPPRITTGLEYDRCLGMLADDPEGAAALADTWTRRGGSEGAAHCLALSRIALGDPATAAADLERLGSGPASGALPPVTRTALLTQATQAWLMAGNPARAQAAATLALALAPDDAGILTERAIAASLLERFAAVVDDASHALRTDPSRADALVLRAAARRHLGQEAEALADANAALAIDPDNQEALLERGILRQRRRDDAGARADWQRAVDLAPDSAAADLARQNLALLEAGPPR
jgi:tetratricopeptide (TPR) repeat protein